MAVDGFHISLKAFAMWCVVGLAGVGNIIMYHLVQQDGLIATLVAIVIDADANVEIGVSPSRQSEAAFARHGSQPRVCL